MDAGPRGFLMAALGRLGGQMGPALQALVLKAVEGVWDAEEERLRRKAEELKAGDLSPEAFEAFQSLALRESKSFGDALYLRRQNDALEQRITTLEDRVVNQAQASMELVDALARVRALCAAEDEPHPWHDHICPKDVLDALDGA